MNNLKKVLLTVFVGLLFITNIQSSSAQVVDPNPSGSAAYCLRLNNGLGYRSTDAQTNGEVSDLQDFLTVNGYLSAQPTGYYGLLTVSAVTKFQSVANGFSSPSGFVGPYTRAKIAEITCASTYSPGIRASATNTTTTTTTTVPYASGCTSNSGFSRTTGRDCGCVSTSGFSTQTGKSCSVPTNNSTTTTTTTTSQPTFPSGCSSNSGYSMTTGRDCGCASTSGFSTQTGRSCSVGTTPQPTYPAGCTSNSGYSSTNGSACNGTTTTTTTTSSYPSGCTSNNGYSTTTARACDGTPPRSTSSDCIGREGQSCSKNSSIISLTSPNGGETWTPGTHTISWTSNQTSGYLFLSISQVGSNRAACLIGSPTIDARSYSFYLMQNFSCSNQNYTLTDGSYRVILEYIPTDREFSVQAISGIITLSGVSSTTTTTTTTTNTNPVITATPTAPSNLSAGQSTSFTWRATDSDDDNLSWNVRWDDATSDSTTCRTGSQQNREGWELGTSHAWANQGIYTVDVWVFDCRGGLGVLDHDTFTVTVGGTTTSRSITVTSPNGSSQTWQVGSTHTITWDSSDVNYVNLSLEVESDNNIRVVKSIASNVLSTASTSTSGTSHNSYVWSVPDSFAGSFGNIFVRDTNSDLSGFGSTAITIPSSGGTTTTTTTTTTYPDGCTSNAGWSSTNGMACDGSSQSQYPNGCASNAGFSTTTGASCAGTYH